MDDATKRRLRALARNAGLSLRELADVMGVEYKTLTNHLAGAAVAGSRARWYARLVRLEQRPGEILVAVRYTPTRKRWGWALTAAQRAALLRGVLE